MQHATILAVLEMDCAFSLRYFSRHGDAVHRYRNKHCHRTPVAALINSMDMDTTDLFAEAGLDESGMVHSTTDTAGLELTELAY